MRKFTIRLNKGKTSKKDANPNRAASSCIKSNRANGFVIINRGDSIVRLSDFDFDVLLEAAGLYAQGEKEFIENSKDTAPQSAICAAWRRVKETERALRRVLI
ncbi:MAG: hypothetical protein EKK48_29905 [Candidatus Melainabacteria bacterium]|nr:MAG: hypothetical protein EKK48_29905 [Candidatus Melainabacteria bacterium]